MNMNTNTKGKTKIKKTIRSFFTAAISHHSSDFALQSDLRSVDTATMRD